MALDTFFLRLVWQPGIRPLPGGSGGQLPTSRRPRPRKGSMPPTPRWYSRDREELPHRCFDRAPGVSFRPSDCWVRPALHKSALVGSQTSVDRSGIISVALRLRSSLALALVLDLTGTPAQDASASAYLCSRVLSSPLRVVVW